MTWNSNLKDAVSIQVPDLQKIYFWIFGILMMKGILANSSKRDWPIVLEKFLEFSKGVLSDPFYILNLAYKNLQISCYLKYRSPLALKLGSKIYYTVYELVNQNHLVWEVIFNLFKDL